MAWIVSPQSDFLEFLRWGMRRWGLLRNAAQMKSTLFAAAAALLLSSPALAEPIHLTCKETKVLEATHIIKTNGSVSEHPTDPED